MFSKIIFEKSRKDNDTLDSMNVIKFRGKLIYPSLNQFHKFLKNSFYKLGYTIALNPSYFIVVPILLSLLGITGIQQINYVSDSELLFTPSNGRGLVERRIVKTLFPVNHSDNFDFFRLTEIMPVTYLLVSAKDDGTMFRVNIFEEIAFLDKTIQNMSVELEDSTYHYSDVCAKLNGKCSENIVLNLREFMPEIENGSILINYPIMLYPLSLPNSYGGAVVNESEGVIVATKAVSLSYFFIGENKNEKERSHKFEKKILEFLADHDFEFLKVVRFASRSMDEELEKNVFSRLPDVAISGALMTLFIVGSIALSDWVRSKLNIGLLGMLSAVLATSSSFGFLMYGGVSFVGINMAAPFLMLGVGIDDMFVVLSAWHRTDIQEAVPVRLAKTYREAAISVTITSLTNMLSFFIGTITPFPAVRIFCLYTGFSVLFTYIWFLTFFGGCLAKVGNMEREGRHSITGRPVLPKSKAENMGCCYRIWCSGGIDPENPRNPKDNKSHIVMAFFRDYFAKILNIPWIKVLVICSFAVYLGGAIYGCTKLKEGLQLKKLALEDSYLVDFFEVTEKLFTKYPYRIQVIINERLNYSDPETKAAVLNLHETFENLSCVAPQVFSQSWMRGFYKFLDRRPHLKANIHDEKSFIEVLKSEYLAYPKIAPEHLDIKFNEDETEIIASRFIIQTYDINGAMAEVEMMLDLRKVAEDSIFNVVVYNILFPTIDQYTMMKHVCIQTVTLAAVVMITVSLIFIPNPLCSLWIAFSIISIEIGVVGYMSLWDVRLDSVSVINLIVCIGFSVDFSAHISYAYLTSLAKTASGKVEECLYNMGLPILQGGLSTILGVLILIKAPSYLFTTFFKTIFLVVTFGILHSLLLLPVLLSILGPKSSEIDEVPDSEQKDIWKQNIIQGDISTTQTVMKGDIISEYDSINNDLGIGSSSESDHSSLHENIETKINETALQNNLFRVSLERGNQNKAFIIDAENKIKVERL